MGFRWDLTFAMALPAHKDVRLRQGLTAIGWSGECAIQFGARPRIAVSQSEDGAQAGRFLLLDDEQAPLIGDALEAMSAAIAEFKA